MSVRNDIAEVFTGVAQDHAKRLVPLADDVLLMESGVDPVCLAVVITRLDATFGVDPFNASDTIGVPATFGEFVSIYEKALGIHG